MVNRDSIHIRLFRELSSPSMLRRSGLESLADLSKKLRVNDQTVRSALKRMEDSGFLKTWSAILNPHIFNMEAGSVLLESGREASISKDEIVTQLKLIEGVVIIFRFHDEPGFRVIFYYEDQNDLDRKLRLMCSICRTSHPPQSWELNYPSSKMKLKRTDWQLIRILLINSRGNTSDIAASIGVSSRTVRRRLALLTQSNVFFVDPVVDIKRIEGFLYLFIVSFANKKRKSIADRFLLGSTEPIIFFDTTAELYTVIAAICQNISQAHRISSELREMDGVKDVISKIVEDRILVHDWLYHEIEKRIET